VGDDVAGPAVLPHGAALTLTRAGVYALLQEALRSNHQHALRSHRACVNDIVQAVQQRQQQQQPQTQQLATGVGSSLGANNAPTVVDVHQQCWAILDRLLLPWPGVSLDTPVATEQLRRNITFLVDLAEDYRLNGLPAADAVRLRNQLAFGAPTAAASAPAFAASASAAPSPALPSAGAAAAAAAAPLLPDNGGGGISAEWWLLPLRPSIRTSRFRVLVTVEVEGSLREVVMVGDCLMPWPAPDEVYFLAGDGIPTIYSGHHGKNALPGLFEAIVLTLGADGVMRAGPSSERVAVKRYDRAALSNAAYVQEDPIKEIVVQQYLQGLDDPRRRFIPQIRCLMVLRGTGEMVKVEEWGGQSLLAFAKGFGHQPVRLLFAISRAVVVLVLLPERMRMSCDDVFSDCFRWWCQINTSATFSLNLPPRPPRSLSTSLCFSLLFRFFPLALSLLLSLSRPRFASLALALASSLSPAVPQPLRGGSPPASRSGGVVHTRCWFRAPGRVQQELRDARGSRPPSAREAD
jgi:hypothetical protein